MEVTPIIYNKQKQVSFKGYVHKDLIKYINKIEENSLYAIQDDAHIEGRAISEELLAEIENLFSGIKFAFMNFAEKLHDKTVIKLGFCEHKTPYLYVENKYTGKVSLLPDDSPKAILCDNPYHDSTSTRLFRPYDIAKEGFKTRTERLIDDFIDIADELKSLNPNKVEKAMFDKKCSKLEEEAENGGNIFVKLKIKSGAKNLNKIAKFLNDSQDYKSKLMNLFDEANSKKIQK